MQNFKSKFKTQFSIVSLGDQGIILKNTIKKQYLNWNELAAQILSRYSYLIKNLCDAFS